MIVKCLEKQGVKTVFGITGGAIMPVYDSLFDVEHKIKNIICRHEQGAAHMAAGYARACGKPGVAMGTSGPGGSNLVTGIMDAYMDSTPMVTMTGQVPRSLIGRDAFQETDIIGLTMPVTKHNFQVREPSKLAETMMKAFKISIEGRPGPVHVDLPKDVQTADVNPKIPDKVEIPSFQPTPDPNMLQIKKAVKTIINSERPVIIAGGGTIIAGAAKELLEFSELSGIPVNTTTMGKGVFPENHPLSLGVMGMHGTEQANYAAINSDCLITIGCRFSDRITGDTDLFEQGKKIIHADIDPSEIGKNVKVDVPIVADARKFLQGLSKVYAKVASDKNYKGSPWLKKMEEVKAAAADAEARDIKGMTQANLLTMMSRFIKDDDVVCTGVGQHQMFGEHFLHLRKPRTWITSGGAGTMGYGLPAAMGARFARPDSEVYDLDGDGSFQMNSQELATAKQYGIKVTPIIMNNGFLGMVRQWQELFNKKRYAGVDFTVNPDFVKLAQAYHLEGISVTRESEFEEALKRAKKSDETLVIDCKVEREENILPMLPPGKGLQHIIGGKTVFNQTWNQVR